jgi:hypothetical protein
LLPAFRPSLQSPLLAARALGLATHALGCSADYSDSNPLCPITGFPCEGDLSHLCEDYGCVRKAGLPTQIFSSHGFHHLLIRKKTIWASPDSKGSHAFAKRQRLLSPKQYEIVEVRTSRGMNRALLFSNAILLAEWEANAPYARRWQSSASDGGPNRERPSSGPASEERVPRSRQELFGRG